MKKFILTAVAAAVTVSPIALSVAEAAPQRTVTTVRERPNGRTVVTQRTTARPGYRSWRRGERFDSRYAQNYQVVDYRRYRGLRAPPRGYHYVRSGNDAVLVGITSGVIAAVVANAIR